MKIPMVLSAALLAAGCAGLRTSPAASEVHKAAFVALSLNTPFRNTEAKKDEGEISLKGLVKTSSENCVLDEDPEALRALLKGAQDAFAARFAGVHPWTFMSQETLAAHPAFQAALKSPGWARSPQGREAAPDLLPTALDDLTLRVVNFGSKTPSVREKLAALAKDLGVDAVVIVDLDMGYTLTGNTALGLAEARPDVAARLAVVNQGGETVVQAKNTTRFLTPPLWMVKRQKTLVGVELAKGSDLPKVAKAYAKTVDSAAELLVEDLNKKLAEAR